MKEIFLGAAVMITAIGGITLIFVGSFDIAQSWFGMQPPNIFFG